MNYRAAVKAFFDGGGQLQLGVGASLAVGPLGRAADISASAANASHIAATYAYSASKGLYIGYSFEGSKISERVNTNAAYYGRPITAREILTGQVPPPQDAARLYDMLNAMGAGPREGLPFASQKGKRTEMQQQTTTPHTPPPVNYANRPPTTADGFEEPPPPYQPNEKAPTTAMNNQSTPYNTAFTNNVGSSSSTTPFVAPQGDVKAPIVQPNSSSHGSEPHPEFNRGTINPTAVHNTGHNSASYEASSSTAPSPANNNLPPQQTDIKKPLPEPTADAMTVVVAKYDYHSDSPSDLTFSAGDHIIVTKRLDDRQAWWEGEIGTKRGFFPANYTEEITD